MAMIKCPECGEALITTPRGNVKCSGKNCNFRVKTEKPKTERKKKNRKNC